MCISVKKGRAIVYHMAMIGTKKSPIGAFFVKRSNLIV